jgi:hypothetical protein
VEGRGKMSFGGRLPGATQIRASKEIHEMRRRFALCCEQVPRNSRAHLLEMTSRIGQDNSKGPEVAVKRMQYEERGQLYRSIEGHFAQRC